MTKKCIDWLNNNTKSSPKLVFDLEEVKNNYHRFKRNFKNIKPYYAVKANPNKKILLLLKKLGSNFDCASISEIIQCYKLKVSPGKISYGNTVKKSEDIKKAFNIGVKLFAFDCENELVKLSKFAPGSEVYCRIQVPNGGAEWPLSKKFGCKPLEAEKLMIKAAELDLKPIGLSFHVGSQQLSVKSWDTAIRISSNIYKKFNKKYFKLNFLNIGGGMPVDYKGKKIDFEAHAKNIIKKIKKNFNGFIPNKIIAEPGRFLVASSGVLESEIILIKNSIKSEMNWLYLDVGRYSGLAETEGEAIKYKIETVKSYKNNNVKYIIAGPSCDSHDILYQKNLYNLPKNINIGDRVRIYPAGAYTTSYETSFNGIKKIKKIFLD